MSRASGASAGCIWLSFQLSLVLVVVAAKFHSLFQFDIFWRERPVYTAGAALVSSSTEILLVTLVSAGLALLWRAASGRPARAAVGLAAALAWLTIWSVNLINAEMLPRAYAPLSLGLIFLADLFGSSHGGAALGGWMTSQWLWLVVAGLAAPVLAYAAVRLVLAWIRARAFATLIGFGTAAVLLADLTVSPTPDPWARSGTFAFLRSTDILFAPGLEIASGPVEPLPGGRVEAGIPEERVRPPFRNAVLVVLESASALHLGVYGGPDAVRFAAGERADALIVSNAYAHSVESNRSAAAILSGSYPLISYWKDLSFGVAPGLPGLLEKQGVRTAFFHSSDSRADNLHLALRAAGFGTIRDFRGRACPGGRIAAGSTQLGTSDRCTFEELRSWIERVRPKRFFGAIWTFQSHYPYYWSANGKLRDAVGRPDREVDYHRRAIAEADGLILELLRGLAEAGIAEETLVIVTADHGEAFASSAFGKRGLDEEGVRIPLILINPRFAKLGRIGRLTGHIDIAPTLAHALGIEPHPDWQGRSLFRPLAERPVFFSSLFETVSLGYRYRDRKVVHQLATGRTRVFEPVLPGGETRDRTASMPPGRLEMDKRRLFDWAARSGAGNGRGRAGRRS